MTSFLSNLNIRQLIIHFIASWFFIYAVHTLITLFDFSFLYNDQVPLMSQLAVQERYNRDLLIINQAGILGLLIAYVISWRISVKYDWFWLNSVIVLVVAFPLAIFDLLGWKFLRSVCMAPGYIFGVNSVLYLVINGVFMLAVGAFLFYRKGIIAFIEKGVKREKKVPTPRVPKANKA